jgi:predicted DNA-binding protein (UPF0251 family)
VQQTVTLPSHKITNCSLGAGRYRILRLKDLMALSADETARMFALSKNTIARWHTVTMAHPEQESIGPPVKLLISNYTI